MTYHLRNNPCSRYAVTAVCLVLVLIVSRAHSKPPLDIGTQNQIFIDGRLLAKKKHVQIVVQQPRKTGEMHYVTAEYLQIMENDGVFKYFGLVSDDGKKWEKPTQQRLDQGKFKYGIYWSVPERPNGVVFKDPKAPPEERYKVVSGMANRIHATADGSKWKVLRTNVFPSQISFPRGMDSQNVAFYDDKHQCYVAYVRSNMLQDPPPQHRAYFKNSRFHNGKNHLRCVRRCTSKDLKKFTKGKIVLAPDKKDPIMDGVGVGDFYMPQVIKYPHAQDAYVMFPTATCTIKNGSLRRISVTFPRTNRITSSTMARSTSALQPAETASSGNATSASRLFHSVAKASSTMVVSTRFAA